MGRVRAGTIGILPAGALGVSLFYHLTDRLKADDGNVFFVERPGSRSAAALREKGELVIAADAERFRVSAADRCRGDLLEEFQREALPEILLLCPNPDQLPGILRA